MSEKKKAEKIIVFKFEDKKWTCKMRGSISHRDINTMPRLMKVSFKRHLASVRTEKLKDKKND